MTEMGPRSIRTNLPYRNAVARARGRALSRLIRNHPTEYQRLLSEERVREGLAYRRKPKPRDPYRSGG